MNLPCSSGSRGEPSRDGLTQKESVPCLNFSPAVPRLSAALHHGAVCDCSFFCHLTRPFQVSLAKTRAIITMGRAPRSHLLVSQSGRYGWKSPVLVTQSGSQELVLV